MLSNYNFNVVLVLKQCESKTRKFKCKRSIHQKFVYILGYMYKCNVFLWEWTNRHQKPLSNAQAAYVSSCMRALFTRNKTMRANHLFTSGQAYIIHYSFIRLSLSFTFKFLFIHRLCLFQDHCRLGFNRFCFDNTVKFCKHVLLNVVDESDSVIKAEGLADSN